MALATRTVGQALAEAMDCSFLEADDFHSENNKDKMSKGIPLSDDDRVPWLEALRDAAGRLISNGETVVLTCSALQKNYREILRKVDTRYETGNYSACRVRFVCLEAPMKVIAGRIEARSMEGNHFMPVTLLQSQFDLLQKDDANEEIVTVDATSSLENILRVIQARLKL